MNKILRFALILTVLIGTISLGTFVLGGGLIGTQAPINSFLSIRQVQVGNYTTNLYVVDLQSYASQLNSIVNIKFNNMFLVFPNPLTFIQKLSDQLASDWTKALEYMLKYFIDYIIWELNLVFWVINNFLVFPFKILSMPIYIVMTILGINMNPNQLQLYTAFQDFYNFTIQYVDYWY